MSQAQPQPQDYRLDPKSSWANAWKLSAAVGIVGVIGAVFAAVTDMERFAFSYLFAYLSFLTIALGGVFFGLIQYLTSSGWSVTIRRTFEFLHAPIWLFVILFAPIAINLEQLYPWTHTAHGDEHGAEHGAEHGGAHGDVHGAEHSGGEPDGARVKPKFVDPDAIPAENVLEAAEHHEHAKTLKKKLPYLNKTFFYIRAVIYFLAWVLISRKLFNNSTKQDATGDLKLTASSQRIAPASVAALAFTTTFAAFDWLMSLEPSWISTIFGVNFFAQCLVAVFAVAVLMGLSLRAQGHFKNAVTVEHFHDLGKLMFGFLVFWAYVNFCQYMLIWYASIPEETTYYHKRWMDGGPGWQAWTMAVLFGHFVIPFLIILSRNAKRALTPLGLGAAIILLFHFLMVYWLVMPYYGALSPSLADLACLMAVGGLYFSLVLHRMTKHPIIPVRDPRLGRSLHFVNA